MKINQFPSKFRTIGVAMLMMAAGAFFLDQTGIILHYFTDSKPANGASILPADYIKASFYIYQILTGLMIVALIFIVLSKQRIEDEWIKQKRLVAYKVAFLCGPVLTVLFLRLNYELIVTINLVLLWVIQYVVFIYLVKVQPYIFQKLDENQSA